MFFAAGVIGLDEMEFAGVLGAGLLAMLDGFLGAGFVAMDTS